MNFFLDSVSANTTLAYFNGFRLSQADVFSWNPFKKTSVYLVETSGDKGKDINDKVLHMVRFINWAACSSQPTSL